MAWKTRPGQARRASYALYHLLAAAQGYAATTQSSWHLQFKIPHAQMALNTCEIVSLSMVILYTLSQRKIRGRKKVTICNPIKEKVILKSSNMWTALSTILEPSLLESHGELDWTQWKLPGMGWLWVCVWVVVVSKDRAVKWDGKISNVSSLMADVLPV